MFSSVSPSECTGSSPVWARISRTTRLVSIERSIRDILRSGECVTVFEEIDLLLTLRGTAGSGDGNPTLIKATVEEVINSQEVLRGRRCW